MQLDFKVLPLLLRDESVHDSLKVDAGLHDLPDETLPPLFDLLAAVTIAQIIPHPVQQDICPILSEENLHMVHGTVVSKDEIVAQWLRVVVPRGVEAVV